MTKRYVFWRAPDGKPHRKDDGQFSPSQVLAQLGKLATINAEGNVQWNVFNLSRFDAAIRAAIAIIGPDDEEMNGDDTWNIVRPIISGIIKKTGGGKAIDPNKLLIEADGEAAKYYRSKPSRYILVASLSVKAFPKKSLTIGDCRVAPLAARGTRYPLPVWVQRHVGHEGIAKHIESSRYQLIQVETVGRTVHDAAATAFHAIALLRGYWSLLATRGQWSRSFGSLRPKAIGVIHAGPVHTLHHLDGTLAENNFWYEPEFVGDVDLFDPKRGWDRIEKDRLWAISRVKRLRYRTDLENLITRYAVALDQTNLDLAFLQMWGILEKLTDTVGAKYDQTISRAVWIFNDRKHAKELLETLRMRRNQFVHAARTGGHDRDEVAYMIKDFIDSHLMWLIRNEFQVDSLEEYGKHLGQSSDVKILKDQRKRLNLSIKFLEKIAKNP